VPDAAAGEAVHDTDAETLRRVRGLDEFFRRALTHAFGITVAIDVGGEDLRVAGVDVVAHRLADEMSRDRVALHARRLQLGTLGIAVGLIRLIDFKVIAPAGKFDTIVAEGLGLLDHGIDGKIGPLAGEKCDGAWHVVCVVELRRGRRRKFGECRM
jgi:hypothetical protein